MTDQPQGEKLEADKSVDEKPALTVVIQSWWTPALAVIMLVVGLLAGYFGRPLINNSSADARGEVAVATTNPTATVDPQQIKQVMDSIVSQTTNFVGEPNAKVTLIEFSDYQ
jgi:protein-disulfide isomerase